jgi:Family of unknown function (DUF6178)
MDKAEERSRQAGADKGFAPVLSLPLPSQLPEDPEAAEKIFNSLPVKSQLDFLLQSRGKERLHCLFLSNNPEQLVQQLPEIEVFLTVKEAGEMDSLPLISLTTPEQFQFLLDLDFWKRDELDPEKILHWLEILLECGEKKIAQFIQSTDPEFIALLLKKFLRVFTLEGEPVEVEETLPPFTLDHYYFIHFTGKETRPVLEPFLKIFSLIEAGGYQRLMEALVWELDSELEEGEYRIRNGRLSEQGFPDFEEALEIYRFIHPDSMSLKGKIPSVRKEEESDRSRPTFYLTFSDESPFFSSVLGKIDDPLDQDRLKVELTALCNRAMVAEATDLSRFEEIERITKKVFHYLNIGLQYLSREEETRALEILHSLPLQRLFQAGVSLTHLLKRKAETLLNGPWFGANRENLLFLDPPYLERFEGILKKRPSLDRNGKVEDFKDLQELKETENLVETVETVVHFLGKHLNVSPGYLKNLNLMGCHPEDWRGITLSTLFLTALANQALKGSFRFEAIEKAQLNDLFSRMFEKSEQGKGMIKMEIRNGLRDWLDSIENDENKRDHLLAFRDFCLDLFELEFGKIPPGEEIDPRFVKGLLICG